MSKDDTAPATKADIQAILTKLEGVATKAELDDVKSTMATKSDLHEIRMAMATKDDVAKQLVEQKAGLTKYIDGVEQRLTRRINSLGEDLEATMTDTINIRRKVGMPVGDE